MERVDFNDVETSTLLLLLLETYLIMSKHTASLFLSKKLVFISNFNVYILMFVIFYSSSIALILHSHYLFSYLINRINLQWH